MKVLIADDFKSNRETIREVIQLDFPKIKCVTAENGREAFEKFKKEKPEIVITDIFMDRAKTLDDIENGPGLTMRIKQELPATLIIALSREEEYKDAAMSAGADKFFLKDHFRIEELLSFIKEKISVLNQKE